MSRLADCLIDKITRYLRKQIREKRGYLCDFGRLCHEVRPADVLLVEGRDRISRIIQRITESTWSHASLYIGKLHDIEDPALREHIHLHYKGRPNDQLVIESHLGEGTVISSINRYKDDHIRICRPSDLSYQDAQKVIAFALSRLGKPYNIRHIMDLGRFLLASPLIPRRWMSTLFRHHPDQLTQDICSSMIASAFISIKFPVIPLIRKDEQSKQLEMIQRNPKLFTPSDFDYSPYFSIIKYPFHPASHHAPYRDLPWREELIHSDELGVSPSNDYPTPPGKNVSGISATQKKEKK